MCWLASVPLFVIVLAHYHVIYFVSLQEMHAIKNLNKSINIMKEKGSKEMLLESTQMIQNNTESFSPGWKFKRDPMSLAIGLRY